MFSTKYTQNPTGLSYANIIIIISSSNSIRLISYKSNLFGFKYLYKYTDKQTRLPLPRRSDIHSGFKDGWISVGALEDSEDSATKLKDNSTNLTQWISFNKSHSEYPAAFNCFFLFFFFFALYLGICLLFTKNRWNFSFPIHKWQRENQLALLTNVAIHHFLFYEGGCVQLRAALWGSQLISNHLLVSLPFPAHIFTLKTSLLPSLHLVFSFFSSAPLLHHSSSHTVTSFLLPVRSPWPPPPPGMKCSCSIVFCLLLAKAIRRALGWPPPVPPWESQPPCMPMPDMVVVLRSCSWPDVGWEFILIMWWRSMDGVTQMFCCDWAFWWWLSRPMVGTIPVPPPRSLVPGSRPIVISRSSRRSGETRSRSWDLETQTSCQCHKSITIFEY